MNIFELAMLKKLGGGNGGSSVQSDLSQNDPNAADYVKNRTHWEEGYLEELLPKTNFNTQEYTTDKREIELPSILPLKAGSAYIVEWEGAKYEYVAQAFRQTTHIGNASIMTGGIDTGEPFQIATNATAGWSAIFTRPDVMNATVSVKESIGYAIHKLDKKFLPDDVATKADIFGAMEASY